MAGEWLRSKNCLQNAEDPGRERVTADELTTATVIGRRITHRALDYLFATHPVAHAVADHVDRPIGIGDPELMNGRRFAGEGMVDDDDPVLGIVINIHDRLTRAVMEDGGTDGQQLFEDVAQCRLVDLPLTVGITGPHPQPTAAPAQAVDDDGPLRRRDRSRAGRQLIDQEIDIPDDDQIMPGANTSLEQRGQEGVAEADEVISGWVDDYRWGDTGGQEQGPAFRNDRPGDAQTIAFGRDGRDGRIRVESDDQTTILGLENRAFDFLHRDGEVVCWIDQGFINVDQNNGR